jgi:hypothetical protein
MHGLPRLTFPVCPAIQALGWTIIAVPRGGQYRRSHERAYQLEPNDPSHALNLGVLLIEYPERLEEGMACLRHADRLGHRRAGRIIGEVENGKRSPRAKETDAVPNEA